MTLLTWFQTNQSQILTALGLVYSLAVVVNGLLPYNSKARNWLGWVIDRLSPFARKDSPGTFKVPLVQSSKEPPPDGKLQPLAPKGFAGGGLLVWLALVAGAFMLFNCAWVQHAKDDVVQCSKDEIPKLASQVLADVTQILLAGVAGWQAELASIASKVGEDVVGCVVAKLASGWTPAPGAAPALTPAAVRAYQYLNQQQPKQFQL